MSKEWQALAAEMARLRREKAVMVAALEQLALVDCVRDVALKTLENVK